MVKWMSDKRPATKKKQLPLPPPTRQHNTPTSCANIMHANQNADVLCHVQVVAGLVSAGLDVRHFLLGEGRQGDGLDAVGELAVDAAAGRAHERVKIRDDPLR